MPWELLLALIIGAFLVLLLLGVPVAFAFLFVNLVSAYLLWGGAVGLKQLVLSIFSSVTLFSLLPVPMFLLMGELMFRSNVGQNMIDAVDKWLGRLPGRLSLVAVAGGTIFATLSGSSMASTAMLGQVLIPEMERRGYKKPMSVGPILGSGGLAIMIPPSALGVLLASMGQFPVGRFLVAIIIPGMLMAGLYSLYIVLRCWLQPSLAPSYEVGRITWREKVVTAAKYILPLGSILFLVIGLMALGVATPTESAALGALGTLILAWVYRGLNWKTFIASISGTVSVTAMVLMILTGSTAFSQILAFSGATRGLVDTVSNLPVPPLVVVLMMQLIILLMGSFMEPLSIILVTLPIFLPIIKALGLNPMWFGAIMLINLEMATTTPPFGLGLFVMKGVAPPGTTMGQIYNAALPFLLCDAVAIALLFAFPSLALWLPSLMK